MIKIIEIKSRKEIQHAQHYGYSQIIKVEDAIKLFQEKIGREIDGFVYYQEYEATIDKKKVKRLKVYIYDEEFFKNKTIMRGNKGE